MKQEGNQQNEAENITANEMDGERKKKKKWNKTQVML